MQFWVGNLCSISNIQWFTSETGITGPFKKSYNISLDIAVGRIGDLMYMESVPISCYKTRPSIMDLD